jgi:hypothetical protein
MCNVRTCKGIKEVKNLGWLLRHAAQVDGLEISKNAEGSGCLLIAIAGSVDKEKRFVFTCHFASHAVCLQWIRRPSLAHAEVTHLN